MAHTFQDKPDCGHQMTSKNVLLRYSLPSRDGIPPHCVVPENTHTLTEGGVGMAQKFNARGVEWEGVSPIQGKNLFVREIWILFTTYYRITRPPSPKYHSETVFSTVLSWQPFKRKTLGQVFKAGVS